MNTLTQDAIKFVMLHNFSNREISLIINAIKKALPESACAKQLVFTKTTERSLQMQVQELIQDASEDHVYLMENPPELNTPTVPDNNPQCPIANNTKDTTDAVSNDGLPT